MVLSTRVILQLAIVAVMMLVVSAQTRPPKDCYRRCIKDGNSSSYCQKSCLDPVCYRSCIKMGEPADYCRRSCVV
ncbi:hypothetical protein BGW41_001151 [Actinomortierella wolfii]|nr:hypothetical protein BGW41_001151 [Actinomortierella wolfii]